MNFLLWLINLMGIRPQDFLLVGSMFLAVAIVGILALFFAWADRHSRK